MATAQERYEAFVRSCGGSPPIRRILVANNGMAARKFIFSVRNWLFQQFGDTSLIRLLAMATPEDVKANSSAIHSADAYIDVPGGANYNNYANVEVITRLALAHKVDAVWPGWGHASENPALPRALESLGIIFIGPSDRAMFLLGDKIASTIIAQSAGVPCISWSGSDVSVTPAADGSVSVPEEVFNAACVNSASEALEIAQKVGYPIMIKASEGGGGKGVRMATSADQVEAMYGQVVDEVKGSPVFLMRLCTDARHIEIQLLADAHGHVAVLSGRDCSMQRRFQKIIEEGPPTAVSPGTMAEMERAAAALAKMVGYTHAGTVEYLFLESTQQFYFLELNPRLQVEHPVTEGITGTNVPSLQLIVAMGCDVTRLPAESSLERFIVDPDLPLDPSLNPFDKTDGHTVAVRITAENAADGWKPTVGAIDDIFFQSMPNVWGYFSVRAPAEVHTFADSQFGHLFAHGKTREQAVRNLQLALKGVSVVGEIHTNVSYVGELITRPEFLANGVTTSWLDGLIAQKMQLQPPSPFTIAICGALLKYHLWRLETESKIQKEFLWRNACPPPEALQSLVETEVSFIWNGTSFAFEVFQHSPDLFTLSGNGSLCQAKFCASPGNVFKCSYGEQTYTVTYQEEAGETLRVVIDGAVAFLTKEKDPSLLQAPYGGKLTKFLVDDGAHVGRGAPFAEMEVMKMLFSLPVAEPGIVSLLKPPGTFVEAGELIARLELDDPSLVAQARPFDLDLGDFEPPEEMRGDCHGTEQPAHQQLAFLVARCHHMLDGYIDNEDDVLQKLSALLLDPRVMWCQFEELMAGPGAKLPQAIREALSEVRPKKGARHAGTAPAGLAGAHTADGRGFGADVLEQLAAFEVSLAGSLQPAFRAAAEGLYAFGERFSAGMLSFSTHLVSALLEHFLDVEQRYPHERPDSMAVKELHEAYPEAPHATLQALLSHNQLERKVGLVLNVLDLLVTGYAFMDDRIFGLLKRLGHLKAERHSRVQRKAKAIAASARDNIAEHNKELVLPALRSLSLGTAADELQLVEKVKVELALCQPKLLAMLSSSDKAMRKAVVKAAVLLWYGQLAVSNLSMKTYLRKGKEKSAVTWEYTDPESAERRLGIILVFASMVDLEPNFDDLCSLAMAERSSRESGGGALNGGANGATAASNGAMNGASGLSRAASVGKKLFASSERLEELGRLRATLHVLVLDGALDGAPLLQAVGSPASSPPPRRLGQRMGSQHALASSEELLARAYQRLLSSKASSLRGMGIRAVSAILPHTSGGSAGDSLNYTSVFNFDAGEYEEDKMLRHVLPAHAHLLELERLCNFTCERCWLPDSPHTNVYAAAAREQKLDTRLFVRTLVQRRPAYDEAEAALALSSLSRAEIATAVATLEQALGDARYAKYGESNHIFLRFACPIALPLEKAVATVRDAILPQCSAAISKLRATELELVLALWDPALPRERMTKETSTVARILCRLAPSNSIDVYEEVDADGGGADALAAAPKRLRKHARAGMAVKLSSSPLQPPLLSLEPYALLSVVDQKRLKCQKLATTYAYDFIDIFDHVLQTQWEAFAARYGGGVPEERLRATELVLSPEGERVVPLETPRPKGSNSVGMLAWRLTLLTPEYPAGRELVLIANDITFANGTFGPREDEVFQKASQFARQLRVPRLYVSANSGARFGLSEALKKVFRVQWNDYEPTKGVEYLWLTDKDAEALGEAVHTVRVPAPPEPVGEAPPGLHFGSGGSLADSPEPGRAEEAPRFHNKIVAVIGAEDGLGVESLQGASKIAAETSHANREIFTLGYCTARNIGIGSYVLRLGQRVIQQREAPIILTGYLALNKLLGSNVYESNLQLGGPEVMGNNGVSHLLVSDDIEAVAQMLRWISFVPCRVGAPLPMLPLIDPIGRPIGFTPEAGVPYDPRQLLCGCGVGAHHRPGLLDEGSFVETLADWAKSVVVGRGRLGGMPVGVIVTENRTTEKAILADPANLESKPKTELQAGQVWFPDSAYKTAQAIRDFGAGEGLPIVILANWRGFSGGRKDMFEEVLKFGSFIVDELSQFKQPIMVYIPPHCEIRGGAWVVIDSQINPYVMEMYAAPSARGGVLEPAGIAEIKFRKPEVVRTMMRLDKQLQWMSMNEASGVVRPEDMEARKSELLPYYAPLGESISDLHDRPERMLAKGVIREIVEWKHARAYFYERLRRRVREEELVGALMRQGAAIEHDEALRQIHSKLSPEVLADDRKTYEALCGADAPLCGADGDVAEAVS